MDFEAFYSEQDRRMNLPENDFNDYLHHMNVPQRLLHVTGAIPVDCGMKGTSSAQSHSPHSFDHTIRKLEDNEAQLLSRHEKHQAKTLENDADALSASSQAGSSLSAKTDLLGAIVDFSGELRGDEGPISIDRRPRLSSSELAAAANSPEVSQKAHQLLRTTSKSMVCDPIADIIEYSDTERVRSKSSQSTLKRKPSQDSPARAHVRKRSDEQSSRAQTPSPMEEITSTCPRIQRKSVERRPVSKPLTRSKMTSHQRRIPALDLRPMLLSTLPAGETEQIPTSPIEEDSISVSNPVKAAPSDGRKTTQPAPSLMLLDIQERVTKHLAHKGKQEGKLSKSSLQDQSSVISVSSSPSRSSSPEPSAANPVKRKPLQKRVTKDKTLKKKTQKEKSILMTPEEFAKSILENAIQREGGLTGTTVFYTGGDMQYASERTRGRMNLILRHGGRLVSNYDPEVVTHIVTDAQPRATLRALGLKRLDQIPQHIPTLTWNWVTTRMNKKPSIDACYDRLFLNAAFHERIEAGYKMDFKGKGKAPAEQDISHISEFTYPSIRDPSVGRGHTPTLLRDSESEDDGTVAQRDMVLPSPPASPSQADNFKAGSSKHEIIVKRETTEDPLAEFYEKARSQLDSKWSLTEESDAGASSGAEMEIGHLTPEPQHTPNKREKWAWTCDKQAPPKGSCPNQDVIDKLEELKQLHEAKVGDGEQWRVFSYNKCIRALKTYPKRITSFAEARSIRGIGDKTAAKVMEILQTGDLRRIGYERTEDVQTTKLFQGIYGVGRATAYQWYAAGCRSLEDLTRGAHGIQLTPAQEIGIMFYDDINDRMPRDETKQLFELIKPIALKIDPKLFIEVMGSYRRGKATCGDIDILLTRDPSDGRTHEGVLPRLLADLHAAGILTEDLALPESDDSLENVYRGLCRLPEPTSRRRRIDFLTVPWQSRGAALLYYTGDDIFNRAMRMKANKMGYSLNQRGLFSNVVRDPRDRRIKLNKGSLVASETEKEIFQILNVPWQEPHERIRG